MEGEVFPAPQFVVHTLDKAQVALFAKLAAIVGEIKAVSKEGRNEHFKYDYVREAEVLAEVRESLAKHKVACIPTVAWQEKVSGITKIALDITFVDGEGGGAFTTRWYGEGQDTGDKGLYKSYTGCLKYALLKTFLIPTDTDPEKPTDDDAVEAARERNHRAEEAEKAQKEAAATKPGPAKPTQPVPTREQTNPLICADCKAPISQAAATVSTNHFGRPLCPKCQGEAAKKGEGK